MQVIVFAVGVTSHVNVNELRTIASQPSQYNDVHSLSFGDTASFSSLIMTGACNGQTDLRLRVS